MIKTINRIEDILDFTWTLSKDDGRASYSRMKTKNEVKIQIERAFREDNYNIIASYDNEVLNGVCLYFWLSDDKYVQTKVFLINKNYNQIAEEFIDQIKKDLPGYELLIGLPFSNIVANEYFRERGFDCVDSCIVTELKDLHKKTYETHDQVTLVTKDDYKEYATFHDRFALPLGMYFNSENLYKDIERFKIFVYREHGIIHGSIFVKCLKDSAEVFGLFINEKYLNMDIENILINHMLKELQTEYTQAPEFLYFVDEESKEELSYAQTAGFKTKENYRCFKCML